MSKPDASTNNEYLAAFYDSRSRASSSTHKGSIPPDGETFRVNLINH